MLEETGPPSRNNAERALPKPANPDAEPALKQAITAQNGAPGLDRLIHEPMRLGIVNALFVNPALTFNELKKRLGTTDGNLSVHARKLEEAGYISCLKYFEGRLPKTEYRLAPEGRRALKKYLDHMEALIRATRAACHSISSPSMLE